MPGHHVVATVGSCPVTAAARSTTPLPLLPAPSTPGSGDRSPCASWGRVSTGRASCSWGSRQTDPKAGGRSNCFRWICLGRTRPTEDQADVQATIRAGRPSVRQSLHSADLQWAGFFPCYYCSPRSSLCPLLCPTGLENSICWQAPQQSP